MSRPEAGLEAGSSSVLSVVAASARRAPPPASRLPALDAAIASAVAKQTGRGWRLDKADRTAQIDATVAVAQAVERAEHVEHPARLLGWL